MTDGNEARSALMELHRQICFKNGDHPDEVDTFYSSGADAITRADLSDAKDARIAELEAAIKRQAGAAKTLRNLTLAEVQHIKDNERKQYLAIKTLDSEREANAILTEENEALQARAEAAEAKLAKAVDGLRECEGEIDQYIRQEYPHDHPVQERYRKRDFDANPARTTIAELEGQPNDQ